MQEKYCKRRPFRLAFQRRGADVTVIGPDRPIFREREGGDNENQTWKNQGYIRKEKRGIKVRGSVADERSNGYTQFHSTCSPTRTPISLW